MSHACKPLARRTPFRGARGFSLIELLVAMTVGLILVTGLLTLFSNSSQVGNELEKSIRQLENGRYALELINEDLSLAGYYGEVSLQGAELQSVVVCPTTIAELGWRNPTLLPPTPFEAPVPVTGVAKTETTGLDCLENRLVDTPALVVRRVDTDKVTPDSLPTDRPYFQTSRCASDSPEARFLLASATAGTSAFSLKNQACNAASPVQRYLLRVYYVARCNECGIDTVPTLKRAELRTATSTATTWSIAPLAEGVQDIAFDFGFDTNGNGNADVFLNELSGVAGTPDNDWGNVVGVRVHLLSRATEPSAGFRDEKTYALGLDGTRGPFNDSFKRRVYTATTRLHNVAGPRETP